MGVVGDLAGALDQHFIVFYCLRFTSLANDLHVKNANEKSKLAFVVRLAAAGESITDKGRYKRRASVAFSVLSKYNESSGRYCAV